MTDNTDLTDKEIDRRAFVARSLAVGVALAIPAGGPALANAPASAGVQANDELFELTIADARARMEKGSLTSHALTQRYLARIDAMDKRGPGVNAIIELNPDALAIADAMDAERKAGKVRGPLHGVPVLIKDNIDTADKMKTSAGSLALGNSTPSQHAFIVQRLIAGGAVIIGKTNLSEWANFRSTRSTSGWSGRGGQTNNPYVLDRNPCGSSSGTGAGIAADFADRRHRHRDRWLDHLPVVDQRPRRHQADGRPVGTLGDHSDLRVAGYRRPDGAHRRRRGRAARRPDRTRPARRGDQGERRSCRSGLHEVSRRRWAERRANWRGAQPGRLSPRRRQPAR